MNGERVGPWALAKQAGGQRSSLRRGAGGAQSQFRPLSLSLPAGLVRNAPCRAQRWKAVEKTLLP